MKTARLLVILLDGIVRIANMPRSGVGPEIEPTEIGSIDAAERIGVSNFSNKKEVKLPSPHLCKFDRAERGIRSIPAFIFCRAEIAVSRGEILTGKMNVLLLAPLQEEIFQIIKRTLSESDVVSTPLGFSFGKPL